MDAACGLSTNGHWDGPMICNEMGWVFARPSCHIMIMMGKVPCERAAAPCLGHSPLHTGGPVPNLIGSSGSAMVCIYAGRVWGSEAA
jgi:hypothetical protein